LFFASQIFREKSEGVPKKDDDMFPYTIIADSREQLPLAFRKSKLLKEVKYDKLQTGDYSIKGFTDKIAIERKSASDLSATLSRGNKRFQAELTRAQNMDYFCILIEAPFNTILAKTWPGNHKTRVPGHVTIKTLFTLKFKYGISVIFANNRAESASIIRQLFRAYLIKKQKEMKTT
jgi:DNA excision repair protein ERCC-4